VYQDVNAARRPTFARTKINQAEKIQANAFPVDSFFGAAALYPIASRIMHQKENMSIEPSKPVSHRAESGETKILEVDRRGIFDGKNHYAENPRNQIRNPSVGDNAKRRLEPKLCAKQTFEDAPENDSQQQRSCKGENHAFYVCRDWRGLDLHCEHLLLLILGDLLKATVGRHLFFNIARPSAPMTEEPHGPEEKKAAYDNRQ
jgi:hypothetical protein